MHDFPLCVSYQDSCAGFECGELVHEVQEE